MRKKIFIPFLFIIPIIFSGCSLHPLKMDADKVEEIVKEAINTGVYLSAEEPKIEELYDGRHYTYSFKDERGLPFTVEMTSPYYSLVDYKKGLYESYVVFHTDYRESIMNYYHGEVENLFESVGGISFDEKFNDIISVSDESALESLDDVLLKIDKLYDFDYSYSGELRLELEKNAYWEDYRPYDLLIRYNGKQESIFFTVSEEELLTSENIREIIEKLK